MAVYREVFPASSWDLTNSPERRAELKYRLEDFEGELYRLNRWNSDLLDAGKARLERHGNRLYIVTHEGRTYGKGTTSFGGGDFDDYALVLNEDGSLGTEFYMTTRGGGTDNNWYKVDATPEVVDALIEREAELNYNKLVAEDLERYLEARNEWLTPSKGRRVRVVRGRKVPVGTVGLCIWRGENRFGGERVGLKDDAGEVHWTDVRNVEVVDLDAEDAPLETDYRRPDEQRRASARALAEYRWAHLKKEAVTA